METSGAPRVSHEALAIAQLSAELAEVPGIEVYRGQGGQNRFAVPGWPANPNQFFQYGDLRVETATTTIVVEFESAGTVGNLVKYWPLLASGQLGKRFIVVHVFRIATEGDYLAHRLLWDFLRDRMAEDLARRGVQRPEAWDAQSFTYRPGDPAADAAAYVRDVCGAGGTTAP